MAMSAHYIHVPEQAPSPPISPDTSDDDMSNASDSVGAGIEVEEVIEAEAEAGVNGDDNSGEMGGQAHTLPQWMSDIIVAHHAHLYQKNYLVPGHQDHLLDITNPSLGRMSNQIRETAQQLVSSADALLRWEPSKYDAHIGIEEIEDQLTSAIADLRAVHLEFELRLPPPDPNATQESSPLMYAFEKVVGVLVTDRRANGKRPGRVSELSVRMADFNPTKETPVSVTAKAVDTTNSFEVEGYPADVVRVVREFWEAAVESVMDLVPLPR